MADLEVGFLGGGQMALALAGGAIAEGVFSEAQIGFVEPNATQREKLALKFPAATIEAEAAALLPSCPRIILAVKPHILKAIGPQIAKLLTGQPLVVSIVSGITLPDLAKLLDLERIIRVMPNTPALVGAGASAFSAAPNAAKEDIQWVETLLDAVGICKCVPDQLMHAVTGLSGSGPAYAYMMIEALSDGGVAMGLPRDTALQLAAQTMLGAAQMVLQTGTHPGVLKDQVTSPGGTTIAAVRKLEQAGMRSAVIEAVVASAERSQELS